MLKRDGKMRDRKGLSPVIATVLLIAIALIIALIIFLWARSFIGEKTQKFGSPIEDSCLKVEFVAEAISDGSGSADVSIENRGSVAMYGFEVRSNEGGELIGVGKFQDKTIAAGETETEKVD